MGNRTFERRVDVPVSASELFAWHQRPGAFERLAPPWEDVELVGAPAAIVPGAQQRTLVRVGPFRRPWTSRITDVEEGVLFRDEAVESPFARWIHTHRVEPRGESGSTLVDHIEYALPLGPLGAALGGGFVRRKLERAFAYRHRLTLDDLQRHAEAERRASTGEARPLDVLVTGASGLVGKALVAFLTTGGHRVRRLVRREPRGSDEFRWDPTAGSIDPLAVEGADAVVHLAGENIAGRRWSAAQKDRIRRSRVEGTRIVADAIRAAKDGPRTFVSASAVGWYGDRGDELLDETSTGGDDFLAGVCRDWEQAAARIAGVRCVQMRFGVILSPAGGALRKMLLPFKLGAGGRIGSGRQWMSWVALDDVVGAIHHALLEESLEGPVNTVAPRAVTNADYTRALGSVLGRPTIAPMPAFAARLAFGELADALLLASQRVQPSRLVESGYRFSWPELEPALRHLLGRSLTVPPPAEARPRMDAAPAT